MGLIYNGSNGVNFVPFYCVGIDPFDRNSVICTYVTELDLTTVKAFYYWNGVKLTLLELDKIRLLRGNKASIKLPLVAGNCFIAMADANLTTGFDYLDRQTQIGLSYLYSTFTLSNNSKLTTLRRVYAFCENLIPFFRLKYPLITTDVRFNNGAADKTLELDTTWSTVFNNVTGDIATAIALHNNVYIGEYCTLTSVQGQKYTSQKSGNFELVYSGLFEFAMSIEGPWFKVLPVTDILPMTSITLHVRCGKVIQGLEKLLQTIRVAYTEEI